MTDAAVGERSLASWVMVSKAKDVTVLKPLRGWAVLMVVVSFACGKEAFAFFDSNAAVAYMLVCLQIAIDLFLAGVAIVLASGEIAHILVLGPLVADMAPAHLLGRYLSLYSLTFTGSLALGPAIGGFLLQTNPDAIWWGGALAAVLAGAVLLRLGDRIPDPLHEAPSRLASAPQAA